MRVHVVHVVEVEDGRALNKFCAATPPVFTEKDGYRVVARITKPTQPTEAGTDAWIELLTGVDEVGDYPIDEIDPATLEGTGMAYLIPLIERRQAWKAERAAEAELASAQASMARYLADQEAKA